MSFVICLLQQVDTECEAHRREVTQLKKEIADKEDVSANSVSVHCTAQDTACKPQLSVCLLPVPPLLLSILRLLCLLISPPPPLFPPLSLPTPSLLPPHSLPSPSPLPPYSLPSPSLLPTLFSPSLRRYFTGRTGVKRKRKRGQPSSSSATS